MQIVLLEVDDALAIGSQHGSVLDVPFERHLPVVDGAATGHLTDRERNMLTNQSQAIA